MTRIDAPSPADGTFLATTAIVDGIVTATLVGEAGIQAQGAIGAFLGELHGFAVESRAARVDVDLREVEFMNSTCLKEMVRWLNRVVGNLGAPRYAVRLVGSSAVHWQRRSLYALQCFAPDVVEVQV